MNGFGTFEFWRRWLLIVALALVGFGLFIALFNQTGVFDLVFNDRIDPAFWPAHADAVGDDFQAWIYGVLGATLAGWGVTIVFLVAGPFERREPWAWLSLALGIGLWFVVDTAISLSSGVYFNAFAVNVPLLILAGAPLIATRREFFW